MNNPFYKTQAGSKEKGEEATCMRMLTFPGRCLFIRIFHQPPSATSSSRCWDRVQVSEARARGRSLWRSWELTRNNCSRQEEKGVWEGIMQEGTPELNPIRWAAGSRQRKGDVKEEESSRKKPEVWPQGQGSKSPWAWLGHACRI